MHRIETLDDIRQGLDALCAFDPRLDAVRKAAGDVPLRLTPPGFASLVAIIVSQQVSRASADAILGRYMALVDPLTPETALAGGADAMRGAGLSRPKQRTILAIAEAVRSQALDLDTLCQEEAAEAMTKLTGLPGVGPWTAEVYLLFCAGHPDIFPSRDVALQSAVGHALGIAPRPDHRSLGALAESWSPWRGVAARLFWSYYRDMKGRDALPLVANDATG